MEHKKILSELQALQSWAFDHSIHSFDISARTYKDEDEEEEEHYITATIFKTGDDSEGDYKSVKFNESTGKGEAAGKIADIKEFIGYV
jgi:hypothetical protein